jgi:hypothetical protein
MNLLTYSRLLSLGALLFLEIQKGKDPMRKMPWSKSHGGTAGCTLRLIDGSQYCGYKGDVEDRRTAKNTGKRELYVADSWFTSIKSAKGTKEIFGHELFGVVKTNHAGTPKQEIEKIMEKWNPGSYVVMECKEHGLWMLGYKYSHRKKGELTFCYLIAR